jgi:hypothetical protein
MDWIAGTIVAGYGVASGKAENCPFPGGSIHMQLPFFKAAGIDLSRYFTGTLNVDLAPYIPAPKRVVFDGKLRWLDDLEERFVISLVEFEANEHRYSGVWYYPHPETKVDHFQRNTVVELLMPWIDGLKTGQAVKVGF